MTEFRIETVKNADAFAYTGLEVCKCADQSLTWDQCAIRPGKT